MKLKKEFLVYNKKDEALLVPTAKAGFSGLVQGNRTLGTVLELLQEDTDRNAVIAAMKEQYDAPEGAIECDVDKVIENLRKIGALDE